MCFLAGFILGFCTFCGVVLLWYPVVVGCEVVHFWGQMLASFHGECLVHVGATLMEKSSKKLFLQLRWVFWSVFKGSIFWSKKWIVNTMVSSVCSPSIDRSFFISVKSNQNIACPFQIKRNYLSGPWKLPGILSVAEEILWAIFLHWGHVTGFIFLWRFCAFFRPSRLPSQEYEITNWILICCVPVGHCNLKSAVRLGMWESAYKIL